MTNPATGEVFTDESAWEFVASLLEKGCAVGVIELQKPPGKKGYVLVEDGAAPGSRIYIKLQMMGDCVRGRSFHISMSGASKKSAAAPPIRGDANNKKGVQG